jgi:hypothetical protein
VIESDESLPHVFLDRDQWIRLVIVGIFVVLAVARVVPDVVRAVYPLHYFGYVTNGDGVVVEVSTEKPHRLISMPSFAHGRGAKHAAVQTSNGPIDRLLVGDRIRVDRIKPSDRKPGITGEGYSFDNSDRRLPIERAGHERILHLVAHPESGPSRFLVVLRILLFVVAIGLGAILFLVKPGIATAAFFFFCLGAVEAPATYLDGIIPMPWRPIPQFIDDMILGAVRPALLLFAFCMIDGEDDAPRERVVAWIIGVVALAFGFVHAYGVWRLDYAGLPAEQIDAFYKGASYVISGLTAIAFAVAFVRAGHNDRHRIGWIVAAFAFAGLSHLASDALYPGRVPLWFNGVLVSMTIVPIVAIWVAVVRHQFFNVDFVVSRAVVYMALTAAVIGTLTLSEEIGTYIFYNNTDLAYGVLIAISMAVGSVTGRVLSFLRAIVDKFIFRDRHEQRKALEFIAGYILDAETDEDVYRALLQDAAHALRLNFGGILGRQPDGSYKLTEAYAWPHDCVVQLGPSDELAQVIMRTRGAMTFSGKDTRLIQQSFPHERLTFAAPLFFDRSVSGIVVYGHNVSGLDLDPEERELLVRVVTHASIALNAIELAKYRSLVDVRELSAPRLGTG